MIKILRRGLAFPQVRFECRRCGCLFEVDKPMCKQTSDGFDETCPICGELCHCDAIDFFKKVIYDE